MTNITAKTIARLLDRFDKHTTVWSYNQLPQTRAALLEILKELESYNTRVYRFCLKKCKHLGVI